MSVFKPIRWGAAIGVGILASAAWSSKANAELVLEDTAPLADTAPAPRAEERGTLRQAVNASEKAQSTLHAQTPLTAPLVDSTEVQNVSRSELLRRERVRAEIKNEDLLQERLEELRLRDEQRRTEHLVGASTAAPLATPSAAPVATPSAAPVATPSAAPLATPSPSAAGIYAPMSLQEEAVIVPSTERPGQGGAHPAMNLTPAPVNSVAPASGVQQNPLSYSAASSSISSEAGERTQLSIQPRFGMTQMSSGSLYTVRPRFSSGIALGMVSSENLSFEVGYTYSEFGVAVSSYNPYAQFANQYQVPQTIETVAMKQNLIDAGMKLHLLGTDSKIRPFVGGGAGYSFSYVNYDQGILDQMAARNPYMRNYMGQDYALKSFLGFLSTGVDVRINRSMVLGAEAKYYNVFTSRESSALNNAALWGGYPVYGAAPDADKQAIGGSLAPLNFYSLMGSVTFIF